LKSGWNGGVDFDRWFEWPVNNARLNAESTYHELVPGFENLLTDVGGDLPEFFAQVKAIGKLPDKERQQTLAGWVQRFHGREWTRIQP
jgi:predicted aminopeptidase